MVNSKKKKILSTLAVIAVAATATLGGLSLVGGSNVPFNIANADTEIINKTPESEATKYYVGTPSEGAAGTGTSADDPMSPDSFTAVLSSLKPGDIVYVMPGMHSVSATWAVGRLSDSESTGNYVNGTYDDYIVFKAYDESQQTVLDFSNMTFVSTNRGVHIYGSYYYWSGIDICGAGDNGMYIGGNYNVVENCEFYNNRDTGLQLGRNFSSNGTINTWPNYNLIRNCTSHNNYDNETKGENADGFAAKLTVGYHNIFDGCVAYRNSDDGWDLYGKEDTGIIGTVYMYNCVAFENGFLETTQGEFNESVNSLESALETTPDSYTTQNGDGNGFKLGGSTLEGDVYMYNCYAFNNRMHGVTDNSNPGVISLTNVISYNNSASIDNNSTSETFGQITRWTTTHNNIDIARSESSYNNMTGVLSVYNGRNGTDAYMAAAENCLLAGGSNKWYRIDDSIDANTIFGNPGESVDSVAAADIFAALPANDLGVSGIDIHSAWRNEDGSLNLGDILRIKDYSVLGFEEGEIGANLSQDSQADYVIPDYTFLTDDSLTSDEAARAQAIEDMIYVPVKADSVYQDFDLTASLLGSVNVSWTSSDPEIIDIADEGTPSVSGVNHIRAVVYRDINGDHDVTLTATATVGSTRVEKTFTLTVKQNEYIVGDIIVEGVNISNDSYITTQFSLIDEPVVNVLNQADYSGKLLPEDSYTVETTYMYAPVKGADMVQVAAFTPSNAGIFEITKNVTCGSTSNSYTYTLYVVSQNADVEFLGEPSIGVTYGGFTIGGELNNVSGTLYAMAAEEVPTVSELKLYGQSYDITTDNITAQFEAENAGGYTVYYVICNPAGAATTDVLSTTITTQSISTIDELQELVLTGGQPNVIYQLANDISFADYTGTWDNGGSEGFVGYLDGNGHTISDLTINATSTGEGAFIQRLYGGTLININFDEIHITSTANRAGIFAEAYSGNLINIKMTNVDVHSNGQRVGGLIGQVFEAKGTLPLIIDRVSLVNDEFHAITSNDRRAAGIVGFLQVNTSPESALVDIRISNCYVDSIIGDRDAVYTMDDDGNAIAPTASTYSGEQFSGIFGTFDATNSGAPYIESYSLTIDRCYFVGTVAGANRVSGIIAYQQGTSPIAVSNCISFGDIYYQASDAPLTIAEKNASGIFGGYVATAATTVRNCFAKLAEDNEVYSVAVIYASNIGDLSFWTDRATFDMENIWQFVDGVVTLR